MFSIEISTQTTEDEETAALREELDFEYIRKCVAELKKVIETYGPFKEVREKTENTAKGQISRTYNEKRGWICDELEKIDSNTVWTYYHDPINGMSYLRSGYEFTSAKDYPSRHEIQSWYIAEKPFEGAVEFVSLITEFIIDVIYTDDDEYTGYWRLDLWDLIGLDKVSDEEILGCLAN